MPRIWHPENREFSALSCYVTPLTVSKCAGSLMLARKGVLTSMQKTMLLYAISIIKHVVE